MRDLDELSGALAQGLALQLGNAVLGHHIVHIVAAGGHGRALINERNDLRDGALGGGAGHGHNGAPAPAHIGAADKVYLPAHAADLPQTHAGGNHLAHQVHLHAGIDGNKVIVLADDTGIIDIVHRHHGHLGVVIHIVIQAAGAHQEGRHALAFMNIFLRVGDDTGLYQLYHAVAEHLGMDAEILLILQEQEHRVGNGADAQLQAVAVLHQGGDVLADGALHIADMGRGQLDEVSLLLHNVIQLADMDKAVAHGAGHLGVDLRD